MKLQEWARTTKGLAVLLALTFVAGAALATTVFYMIAPTTVTVIEPISITPAQALSLYPNECKDLTWVVSNVGTQTIVLDWSVSVTVAPESGSTADITLDPALGVHNAPLGQSPIVISVCASNGVVPGDYTIQVEVSRSSA